MSVMNAVLSHLLGIPRIFVTFGTMTIYQGLAYIISGSKTIGNLTDSYKFIGQAKIGETNITYAMIIMAVFLCLISFILKKTYFGRYVFALGGNQEAARLAGINVKKNEILISVIAGFFLGIATLTLVGRIGSATASTGVGTEFSVITGLLLGGVSIRGGEGKINGCVAGILIIALLGNGMQMAGMNIYLQYIVKGIIMLATIGFDTFQMNRRSIAANTRREEN